MNFGDDDFGGGDSRFAAVCALIEGAVLVSSERQQLDKRAMLALHEAGHAVVDHHNGFDVREVSIQESDGKAHSSATGAAVEAILDAPTAAALRPFIADARRALKVSVVALTLPSLAPAVSQATSLRPDVVLMDLGLPVIDLRFATVITRASVWRVCL